MNQIILHGRLGSDPEARTTHNGTWVCSVSLATDRTWFDKQTQQKQKKTEWHRLTLWGNNAENFTKFFKKGDGVIVQGRVEYREYETNGVKKWSTDIVVENWEFPLAKRDGPRDSYSEPAPAAAQNFDQSFNDDDIPF